MPKRPPDLTGMKFGRLSVVALDIVETTRRSWISRCDCGRYSTKRADSLTGGNVISCGCASYESPPPRPFIHKTMIFASGHPLYRTWIGMRSRCRNPRFHQFKDYGGRGIKVCDRWEKGDGSLTGFECFVLDMGEKPSAFHSIDRFPNNDGNYEPSNCRWATPKEQANNRRRAV